MSVGANKAELTVDEVVALLKKTDLPTVVVEGLDEMIVYRRLEKCLSDLRVSVLPVRGRLNVLEVFARRNEIPATVRIAFVVDKDTWVNTTVPQRYCHPSLVLTSGYSIENDVFVDGKLLDLLSAPEANKFNADLVAFVEWYALALSRHLMDSSCPISLHPEHVLNPVRRSSLTKLEEGEEYPESLRQQIQEDYCSLLRGKSLLDLLTRHTSYPGRQPRHTQRAILELVAIRPGSLLKRVSDDVQRLLTV